MHTYMNNISYIPLYTVASLDVSLEFLACVALIEMHVLDVVDDRREGGEGGGSPCHV